MEQGVGQQGAGGQDGWALDGVDAAIVAELQADGRLTYETLAQRVGLSRPATRVRLQRLLESGALRVVAVVPPEVQGLTANGHLLIRVRGAAEPVAQAIAALPEAPFVTIAAGAWPVVAELRATDTAALAAAVERVAGLPGVESVRTQVYVRTLKDPYLPQERPVAPLLDDADRRLLAELQADGRVPFAELAERVGLSAGATRTRVLRLLDTGVARVVALVRPEVLGLGVMAGFAVRLADSPDGVVERIANLPEVSYLARCLGSSDLVGTVTAGSLQVVHRTLEVLRRMEGVRSVESWIHLELVKERYDRKPPTVG